MNVCIYVCEKKKKEEEEEEKKNNYRVTETN